MSLSNVFTAAALASALTFLPYYLILRRERFRIGERRHVIVVFILCSLAFTFEYFFLGPYSFVELSHEGNLNVPVNYYLARGYEGERFSHRFAGGQDLYAMLPGMQYLNPERLLHAVLPTWVVILIHKFSFGAIGFVGAYLLAHRMAGGRRAVAVAVAAIFPVCHIYLLNYSTNWGTGFAVIPFAIYAGIVRSRDRWFYPSVLLAAALLAAAEPIHVFPALGVAFIGGVLLFAPIRPGRVLAAFLMYALFSIGAWHELAYANVLNAEFTSRAFDAARDQVGLSVAVSEVVAGFSFVPIPLTVFGVSLVVLAVQRDRFAFRALAVLVWPFAAVVAAKVLPWDRGGLSWIAGLDHDTMLISLTGLCVPVAARALRQSGEAGDVRAVGVTIRPEAAVLAAALALLTWNKLLNLGLLVWSGGQGAYFTHHNLRTPAWAPPEAFRVVTLFETPPPNITAGFYGFDSFDGQLSRLPDSWRDYWREIVPRNPALEPTGRTGIDWRHWDGRVYAIEDHVRLDLLGIANVRYLFSALPLAGDGLHPVSAPSRPMVLKARPENFESLFDFLLFRAQRLFDAGDLYVYELAASLPRVFAARDVVLVHDDVERETLYEWVAAVAPQRSAVVFRRHAEHVEGVERLRIEAAEAVTDGYDVRVSAPKGGLMVVNNVFNPFWTATADGRSLPIIPVNAIHMAVRVPPGARHVEVRYRRPLLREAISRLVP